MIKRLYWRLRYALQRAWRGYDDADVFELYGNFSDRMIKILKAYDKSRIGIWFKPESTELFTNEEISDIISCMIFHLQWSDPDYVFDQKYGDSRDAYVTENYRYCGSIARQNLSAFMKLFEMFFYDLWD